MPDFFDKYVFDKREQIIKHPKPCFDFDDNYRYFVCNYCQAEIIADVVILDYQQAINANRYMAQEHPEFADKLWLFAHSGCGDEWFLHKQTRQVWFYDHDQGEYSSFDDFVVFLVGFIEFIKLIAELKAFELNKDYIGNPQEYFETKIHSLNPLFFDNYPYQIV